MSPSSHSRSGAIWTAVSGARGRVLGQGAANEELPWAIASAQYRRRAYTGLVHGESDPDQFACPGGVAAWKGPDRQFGGRLVGAIVPDLDLSIV